MSSPCLRASWGRSRRVSTYSAREGRKATLVGNHPTVVPAEAPAAPATPAALFTVEVGEPTRDSDLLEQAIGLEPTQMRYPAPKRSVAKKRR